jgi:hypothetical protein
MRKLMVGGMLALAALAAEGGVGGRRIWRHAGVVSGGLAAPVISSAIVTLPFLKLFLRRSEERRVGKEC